MMKSLKLLLLTSTTTAFVSASAMTKTEAEESLLRLKKLNVFTTSFDVYNYDNYLTNCETNGDTFHSTCKVHQNITDDVCGASNTKTCLVRIKEDLVKTLYKADTTITVDDFAYHYRPGLLDQTMCEVTIPALTDGYYGPHSYDPIRKICTRLQADSSNCTGGGGNLQVHSMYYHWTDEPKDICCNDGKVECHYDPKTGLSFESINNQGCCPQCGANADSYDAISRKMCDANTLTGITLAGTEIGECKMCVQNATDNFPMTYIGERASSESDCNNHCVCVGDAAYHCGRNDVACCSKYNGTKQCGHFMKSTNSTRTASESSCEAPKCMKCTGSHLTYKPNDRLECESKCSCIGDTTKMDKDDCQSAGVGAWTCGVWSEAGSYTSREGCESASNSISGVYNTWVREGRYEEGNAIPTQNQTVDDRANTSYSTYVIGGEHAEPGNIIKECINQKQFLDDAAAGLMDAYKGTSSSNTKYSYYRKLYLQTRALSSNLVINSPSAVIKAHMKFEHGNDGNELCFAILNRPINMGKVSFMGGWQSYALINDPRHYQGAEPLVVSGYGSATVLGGKSYAPIHMQSNGTMEVWGTENHGQLLASLSQNIFIGQVTNKVDGMVSANGVKVTLIDVMNEGSVVAQDCTVHGYGIMNKGNIMLKGNSIIDLELIGCYTSAITIDATVTGTLKHEANCTKFTLPSTATGITVTTTEPAVEQKISLDSTSQQSFATTPTTAQLMGSNAFKNGMCQGFTRALGIPSDTCTVTDVTISRVRNLGSNSNDNYRLLKQLELKSKNSKRSLSGVTVTLMTSFDIIAPSTAIANKIRADVTATAFAYTLQKETNSAMSEQDWANDGGSITTAPMMTALPSQSTPVVTAAATANNTNTTDDGDNGVAVSVTTDSSSGNGRFYYTNWILSMMMMVVVSRILV